MKNCPKCGLPRRGEEFKCSICDVFYSQLDEILFEEQQKIESGTIKGRLRRILAAEDRQLAMRDELQIIWKNTPLKTKIALWTIFAFVFALVVTVL